MIAILLGIFFGNFFKIRDTFQKGLDFTRDYLLKLGIICLGIQLKPFEFLDFGKIAIPLILICIISVLIVIKLLIKKLKIPTRMAYLISIGSTVCGTTAIMATAPVIRANKSEVSYAIANITLFGILSMLLYPYFANFYFEGNSLFAGLFLGTAIHETSQVAAAGLIYDQQFNSPETLNIATVTKLIRNTSLIIMIPLFAFLYNRGHTNKKNYSILNIFPYFVLGFVGMIILRNIGDQIFLIDSTSNWNEMINFIKTCSKIFLTMAMAAIGLNLVLGFGNLISFGHAAFFGLGGYISGILATHAFNSEPILNWPIIISGSSNLLVIWTLTIVLCSILGLVMGFFCLRTTGVYFIMITLAFAQMLYYFSISWPAYGGEDGLSIYMRNIFPYFKKLESHKVLNSDFTGHEGPVAVEAGNNMANPLYQAFINAGVEAGYTKTQDYNGYRQEGFGQKFMNVDAGVRASSSYAYLRPIKHRANLKILCKSLVTRIIFEQKKAVGGEILRKNKKISFLKH
mgnify:CR=1 FL=1